MGGFLLALALLPGTCVGQSESLEWLTSASESIGIYRLRDVHARATATYFVDLRGELERSIRGDCPDSVWILEQPTHRVPFLMERILVFQNQKWDGPYFVNLTQAETRLFNCAITTKFDVLTQEDSILAVVKERIKVLEREGAEPGHYENAILMGVPDNSPAMFSIWDMHGWSLAVPADESYKSFYLDAVQKKKGNSRVMAACVLMHCYPEVPMEKYLGEMLRDTYVSSINEGLPDERPFFPAREFAYAELRRRGVKVNRPEGYVGTLGYEDESFCCSGYFWNRHPRVFSGK